MKKQRISDMNTELLLKVADLIELSIHNQGPVDVHGLKLEFDLSEWGVTYRDNYNSETLPECKTVGCIAGFVCAEADTDKYREMVADKCGENIMKEAGELLGLTPGEQMELFVPRGVYYGRVRYHQKTPHILRHMARTGHINWRRSAMAVGAGEVLKPDVF
jgi:hypothetical protein